MDISIIKHSEISENLRFDAEYYKNEYFELEKILDNHENCKILKDFAKKNDNRFNPLLEPLGTFNYVEIEGIDLNNGKYSFIKLNNFEAPSRARKIIEYENVIISTVRPNRNAVALFLEKNNNFVCSTGFSVIKCTKINPYYLFIYLKTKFAIKQLIRRTSAAMYPAVSENDIFNMKIILPDKKDQDRIKFLLKNVHKKEEEADEKLKEAEKELIELLKLDEFKPSHKKTNIINFSDYEKTLRLDARFYLPKYEEAIKAIYKNEFELKTVEQIISSPLTSGSTPLAGSNAYVRKNKGIPFYRIVDLKKYELNEKGLLYIRQDIHNSKLKRSQLKPNDVLFSIAGTIGICAVVPEDMKEGNINQALAIIRLKKEYNPYFIALYFNSSIGKLISEKISRPVVQANLNLSELSTLPVPKIPKEIQNKIADLVIESIQLRKKARFMMNKIIKDLEARIYPE